MRFLLGCAGVILVALLVTPVVSSQANAQIPNPGFEVWNEGFPVGWFTTNVPGVAIPVTPSDTRRSGLLALRGEVLSAFGGIWPPSLFTFCPVPQLPQSLQLYYQFAPQGGDALGVGVVFYGNGFPIAFADTEIVAAAGAFTLLDLPVEVVSPVTPDSCYIYILAVPTGTSDEPTVGTSFLIDDIAFFGVATSVADVNGVPGVFALDQNFPNPFNPSTTIEYSLPEAGRVRLEVFNALGERVATLVDGPQDAGRYRAQFQAASLPSGVYLYRLTAGTSSIVKRMLLVK